MSDRERDAMFETGSVAVFCPTSNMFIGSGHFDWQNMVGDQGQGRIGLATDIGGGTSISMLRTMDEATKSCNCRANVCHLWLAFIMPLWATPKPVAARRNRDAG